MSATLLLPMPFTARPTRSAGEAGWKVGWVKEWALVRRRRRAAESLDPLSGLTVSLTSVLLPAEDDEEVRADLSSSGRQSLISLPQTVAFNKALYDEVKVMDTALEGYLEDFREMGWAGTIKRVSTV